MLVDPIYRSIFHCHFSSSFHCFCCVAVRFHAGWNWILHSLIRNIIELLRWLRGQQWRSGSYLSECCRRSAPRWTYASCSLPSAPSKSAQSCANRAARAKVSKPGDLLEISCLFFFFFCCKVLLIRINCWAGAIHVALLLSVVLVVYCMLLDSVALLVLVEKLDGGKVSA